MAATRMSKRYCVGRCPACQNNLYVDATIDLDGEGHDSPPDPRQEGKVNLSGTISGAATVAHDCRKPVTRAASGGGAGGSITRAASGGGAGGSITRAASGGGLSDVGSCRG